MWKNWIPFRRKEEQKVETTARSAQCGVSNGKENVKFTVKSQDEGNGDRREKNYRMRIPSAETKVHSYSYCQHSRTSNLNVSSNDSTNKMMLSSSSMVLNASGPLLSTPLLPKIRRAVELNSSLSEYGYGSSPSKQSFVKQSASFVYGPTHPTCSTPGRLPVVRLEKRPSLLDMHGRKMLTPGRRVLSPSTVKVAPPDPRMLSSPSFRVSPAPTASVTKEVVDTQMVVAALRERRKRSNLHTDESVVDDSITQISKRRRQDDSLSVTPSASVGIVPDILPDMSVEATSFNSLLHMEKMAMKRPTVASNEPLESSAAEMGMPRMSLRESRNGVLSSLSSSRRAAQDQTTAGEGFPPTKRVKSLTSSQLEASQGEDKRQLFASAHSTDTGISSRSSSSSQVSASGSGNLLDSAVPENKNCNKLVLGADQMASVENIPDVNSQFFQGQPLKIFHSLKTSTAKSMIIASPTDFEADRRGENARVQDVLAYLNDEQKQAESSTPSAVLGTFTSSASFPSKGITTPSTTALTELLSSSGKSTQAFASGSATLNSGILEYEPKSPTGILSSSSAAVPALSISDAISKSTAGLVQSSGVSATTSLVNSTPICSTGSFSMLGNEAAPGGGRLLTSGISTTSAVSVSSSSAASLTVETTSASVNAGTLGSISGEQKEHTFKPLFGTSQTLPVSSSDIRPGVGMGVSFSTTTSGLELAALARSSTISSASTPAACSGIFTNSFASVISTSGTSHTLTSAGGGGNVQIAEPRSGFIFNAATNMSAATSTGSLFGGYDAQLGVDAGNTSSTTGDFFGQATQQVSLTSSLAGTDATLLAGKALQPKNLFGPSKEKEELSQTVVPTFNSASGFGDSGPAASKPNLPSLQSQTLAGSAASQPPATTSGSAPAFGGPLTTASIFGGSASIMGNNVFLQGASAISSPQTSSFSFGPPGGTSTTFSTTSSKSTSVFSDGRTNTTISGAVRSGGSAATATSSMPASGLFAFGQMPATTTSSGTAAPGSNLFGFSPAPGVTKATTAATSGNSLFAVGQTSGLPATTSTPATSSLFMFPQTPVTTSAASAAVPASRLFGQNQASAAVSNAPSTASLFSFGQTPATATPIIPSAPASNLFGFGQPLPTTTAPNPSATASGLFTFGQTPAPTTATNTLASANGMFTFGQTPAPTTAANTLAPANSMFTFGQTPIASTATNTLAPASSLFTFGQTTAATMASNSRAGNGLFGFGQAPANTAAVTTPTPAFGQARPAVTNPSNNFFAFGQSQPTTAAGTVHFGSVAATTPSPAFVFGAATTTNSKSTFAFGSSITTGAGNGLSFRPSATGTTTSNSGFNFGTSVSTGTGGFGTSAPQQQLPNAFGDSGGFSLGSSQPQPQPQPQQGFNFGNSASSTFTFGNVTSPGQAPAFGSGSTAGQSGQTLGSTGSAPAFSGSQSQSFTPVFGMSARQNATDATSTTGGGPFVFGGQGSAQQTSTPFTFSGSTAQSTGTSAGFQFGQPLAGGASGGFNFASSLGSGPQFNFSQSPSMFTTGAGSTAAKPRSTALKGRRRGTRK